MQWECAQGAVTHSVDALALLRVPDSVICYMHKVGWTLDAHWTVCRRARLEISSLVVFGVAYHLNREQCLCLVFS